MTERAPRTQRISDSVPAAGALVNTSTDLGEVAETGVVTAASYTPVTAITGANSPTSRSLILINKGADGTGTTEVGRLDLVSGVNIAADDERQLTLSATTANRNVTSGDILEWQSNAVGGTGLADPGGLAQVEASRYA